MEVRPDSYSLVDDALRASRSAGASHRLVVVALVDLWAPPALALARALEALRAGGDVTYAQILIVDAGADKAAAWELGVVATPALFFYFDGERLRVRRPDREDDDKFVGAATQEQLLEVIRHARATCARRARWARRRCSRWTCRVRRRRRGGSLGGGLGAAAYDARRASLR